jgi:hypothetical protein
MNLLFLKSVDRVYSPVAGLGMTFIFMCVDRWRSKKSYDMVVAGSPGLIDDHGIEY